MKYFKLFFGFLFVSVLFVACDRDNMDVTEVPEEEIEGEIVDTNPLLSRGGGSDEGLELECITILYPFEILDVEEANYEINAAEDLVSYLDNDVVFVDFVYPLDVKNDNDEEFEVNNGEELGEAFVECLPDFNDFDVENDFPAYMINLETSCYELVYPLTLRKLDDSTIEVANEDALSDALASDIHFFEFPFSLVDEDGVVSTVNDDSELFDALLACNNFEWSDSLDWVWEDGFEYLGCYKLEFPFDVVLQDGTVVTVNDHEEYCDLMLQGELDGFAYPLTLTDEDGETQTVNSEDELYELLEECDEWGIEGFDQGFFELLILYSGSVISEIGSICYEIQYPIAYTDYDGQTISIDSQAAIESLFETGVDQVQELVYPIDVVLTEDNSTRTLDSFETMSRLVADCQ